ALHRRQLAERRLELTLDRLRTGPELGQHGPHDAFTLFEERREQMLGLDRLMIVLIGLRLRRLQGFLRLHGQLVQSRCSARPLVLRFVSSAQVRARVVGAQRLELLVQLAFGRRHVALYHDPYLHQLIAVAASFETRHAVPGQPERAPARRRGRDLHRHLAAQGRNFDARAQRGLGRRHRERQVDVVALALEERMRRDRDAQIEVTARPRTAGALAGDAYALAALHARWDLHVDLTANLLPAPSAAGRAWLPLDVAGAMAGRARFLDVHRKGLAGSVKRLVERDLDAGLDIAAARALAALEEVLEPDAFTSRPSAATAHVAEDRAKEVGEVAGAANVAAVLDPEPSTGTAAGRSLGVTLPIRAERVVTAPLLGVRQHLVGFVDLLEAVGGVLALRDVRVVLPREPSIGGLDRLVVGLSVDS